MKNGKSKISWGKTREQAIEILRLRLSEEELDQIDLSEAEKIPQQKLPLVVLTQIFH